MILCGRREVLVNGKPRRIVSRHHRRAAWRTDRIEHVELLEVCPLACEPVEVRRLEPRMPVAREVAPAPVIGEDENNIRPEIGCVQRIRQRQKYRDYESDGEFHRRDVLVLAAQIPRLPGESLPYGRDGMSNAQPRIVLTGDGQ